MLVLLKMQERQERKAIKALEVQHVRQCFSSEKKNNVHVLCVEERIYHIFHICPQIKHVPCLLEDQLQKKLFLQSHVTYS